MLKKVSHIIIAFVLLLSTTGLTVSKHYCHDLFISASLFSEAESCCGEADCCHNEIAFFQVDDDFVSFGIWQLPRIVDHILFLHLPGDSDLLRRPEPAENLVIESVFYPPPKTSIILARK